MGRIEVTDLFLAEAAEPVEVEIEGLHPGNRFLLLPIRDADRRRWQQQHKLCRTCGGLGFVPLRDSAAKCPTCGGTRGPSFDDPAIRKATLAEFCRGWHDWLTASGSPIPYSAEMRDRIAEDSGIYWMIRDAAERLLRRVEEAEEKG